METPLTESKCLKKFSLTSDKSKKYEIMFNEKANNLQIQCQEESNMIKNTYEGVFTLETLKKNKFLSIYDSFDDILDELNPLIDEGKSELKEENDSLKLIINLPIKKMKEISFELKMIEKNDKIKIDELYKINMDLIKRIEILEKEVKELKQKKVENEKLEELDSLIIKTKDNFDFVEKILKENIVNKKIKYKLLYRATRDGDDSNIFHQKCDNNPQILVLFKTTKGIILGGYTEIGYKGSGYERIDNKAFFFSCDRKKIYKVKQNKTAIYDAIKDKYNNNIYGPQFGTNTNDLAIIYVCNNMLSCQCSTTDIKYSTYEGLNSDYEVNNGERYFYLQEIEVYKILFD